MTSQKRHDVHTVDSDTIKMKFLEFKQDPDVMDFASGGDLTSYLGLVNPLSSVHRIQCVGPWVVPSRTVTTVSGKVESSSLMCVLRDKFRQVGLF